MNNRNPPPPPPPTVRRPLSDAAPNLRCSLRLPHTGPVDDNTSGNYYSYNWKLAEALMANIIPIAWSGKGMYQNCCDNGETMPSYYLQTLAGRAYSTDWDFSRYVPDMMIINLVRPPSFLCFSSAPPAPTLLAPPNGPRPTVATRQSRAAFARTTRTRVSCPPPFHP